MDTLRRFDFSLAKFIQGFPVVWQPVMAGVSFLGEPLVVLVLGFTGFVSALQRGHTDIERAFFFGAIAYGLNTALKTVLHRRRPHDLLVTTLGFRSYSFPSGHAFGTVIFYGLFSYLDYLYLDSPYNWFVPVLLGVLTFLIGVSRVFLKTHYPSDVVGGWLLGGLSLFIIIRLAF